LSIRIPLFVRRATPLAPIYRMIPRTSVWPTPYAPSVDESQDGDAFDVDALAARGRAKKMGRDAYL
jgi:hypothetical protein